MSKFLVKLSCNGELLKPFDFKKKPKSKKKAAEKKSGDAKTSQGIVSASIDPIQGSMPRSVKAAPSANNAGLDLDKTPCRKWKETPITFNTFSGYKFNVVTWSSTLPEPAKDTLPKQEVNDEIKTDSALPSDQWTEQPTSDAPTSDANSELPSEQ